MPCLICHSPKSKLSEVGVCLSAAGCNRRRCDRRIQEDDKVNPGPQCLSTVGERSLKFCLLNDHHKGLHLNGTTEWVENSLHPIAAAFKALRPMKKHYWSTGSAVYEGLAGFRCKHCLAMVLADYDGPTQEHFDFIGLPEDCEKAMDVVQSGSYTAWDGDCWNEKDEGIYEWKDKDILL